MKTMSVGLIGTPEQAEEIIASGKADFVVIGRTALYDPRWAWHAAEALGVETDYAPKYRMAQPAIRPELFPNQDRKSVVSGKSVSVRVDLGGRSIIKKKKSRDKQPTHKHHNKQQKKKKKHK